MNPPILPIALGLILLSLAIYAVTIYNGFIQLQNNVAKAWANIEVLLKQRHDEVPNLVASVKGAAGFEQRVMENVTRARTEGLGAVTIHDKAKADEALRTAMGSLFAVAENYPALKSQENFLALQRRLTGLENDIADRREYYNDSVNNFNIRIQQFPDVLLAKPLKLLPKEMFKVSPEDQKLIQVQFNTP